MKNDKEDSRGNAKEKSKEEPADRTAMLPFSQ
ncbi:hypothetical protein CTRC342_04400 [Chlamydia trachomatis RC-F(s)/342]|nr:hypothetical protein CTRC342_04400 [Chlamydia trachomatis RC-F(s)/342]